MTIAGIALSGASVVSNSIAQGKVEKARNGAMQAERTRQQGYDQETSALNAASQDRYQGFEGKQAETATKLGDYFGGQAAPIDEVNASAQLPQSSSNITVQEEDKQRAKARDFTDAQAASLGELRSFGDLLGDTSRLQARDATQIGTIGGFKRGSSAVLPYELEAANSKGAGLKMLGDVLGGAGSLATSAGLTMGAKPALGTAKDPWAYSRTAGSVLPTVPKTLSLRSPFGGQ